VIDLRFGRTTVDRKPHTVRLCVAAPACMTGLLVVQVGGAVLDLPRIPSPSRNVKESDAVASQVCPDALGSVLFGTRFLRWFRSGIFFVHLLQSSVAVQ
jgi:hypothetical protein